MWHQKGLDLNVARDDGVCGCTDGPSMSAAQSNTVHDVLLHPHLRHCSSPASAGWQVTPHHSTWRTAAPTPQTLLVASICGPLCRVAGNTRSAGCHQLFVPRHRRSMFGRQACSVAGPVACNSLPARSVTFLWQFSLAPKNFPFLVLPAYRAQQRLCDYALYKSTIHIDSAAR